MSIKQETEIMLQFVWGLVIIWNTASILKDEQEDHENDESTSNQSESSLHNYTMSDLQVRLYRRLGAKGSYLPLWRVSDRIL